MIPFGPFMRTPGIVHENVANAARPAPALRTVTPMRVPDLPMSPPRGVSIPGAAATKPAPTSSQGRIGKFLGGIERRVQGLPQNDLFNLGASILAGRNLGEGLLIGAEGIGRRQATRQAEAQRSAALGELSPEARALAVLGGDPVQASLLENRRRQIDSGIENDDARTDLAERRLGLDQSIAQAELQLAATRLNLESATASVPDFKDEQSLRKEFSTLTSDFRGVRQSINNINTLANRKDAASDLALVVSFTKLLDPGSVAREGEVSLTQSAASIIDQAGNWTKRLKDGNTLLPENTREQFRAVANDLFAQYQASFDNRQAEFGQIADSFGFDRSRVLVGGGDPIASALDEARGSGDETASNASPTPSRRLAPETLSPDASEDEIEAHYEVGSGN